MTGAEGTGVALVAAGDLPPCTESDRLMFCCGIPEQAVQRSCVLQALLESQPQSRPVKLPSTVKESDFLLWSGNNPESVSSNVLSVPQICAIIAVADVLADTKASLWMKVLASKVLKLNRKPTAATDEELCAILHLPWQIQRALFSDMAQNTETTVHTLMASLPVALHSVLVSSLVTANGALSLRLVPENPLSLASFHAAQLQLAAPLESLTIVNKNADAVGEDYESGWNISSAGILGTSVASHESITYLMLANMQLKDHSAVVLCQQLMNLKKLCSLHIANLLKGPSLDSFAEVMRALPQLTCFHLGYVNMPLCDIREGSRVRSASNNFLQALASAPKLLDLGLISNRLPCAPESVRNGFRALKSLCLGLITCSSPCHDFVPGLSHLTSLDMSDTSHLCGSERDGADYEHFGRILESFVNVVCLRLLLPACETVKATERAALICAVCKGLQAMAKLTSLALECCGTCLWVRHLCSDARTLSHVQKLRLEKVGCDVTGTFLPRVGHSLAELRSLSIEIQRRFDAYAMTLSSFEGIPRFPQLRHLRVSQPLEASDPSFRGPRGYLVLGTLLSLRDLTALESLEVSGGSFDAFGDFCQTLSQLTRLSCLQLAEFRCPDDDTVVTAEGIEVEDYEWVLRRIGSESSSDVDIRTLCQAVIPQLTNLVKLQLHCSFALDHVRQIAESVASLPKITHVSLTYDGSMTESEDDTVGDEQAAVVDGDVVVPEPLMEALSKLQGAVPNSEFAQFGKHQEFTNDMGG